MDPKISNVPEVVILVDAYSQIFRAFYAIRLLNNSRGEPVNALFVFTRLLLQLARTYPGRRGAMLFDCGKVAFRLAVQPDYKANRPPMPEALKVQIPGIREMAEAFGWPLLSCENYEADDLIGGFAAATAPAPVRIISGDKDLSQLVDERVRMLIPVKGEGTFEERGVEEVIRKFSVPPQLIPDYLALVGDSSDNIPGVPGIGPKSAAELLREFGPIENWNTLPGKIAASRFGKKLTGWEERLRKNLLLVRLRTELPEKFNASLLQRKEPDWPEITRLCREQEFRRILQELPAVAETASPETDDLFSAHRGNDAPQTVQPELF